MSEICNVCGLPKDLCICDSLAKEGQEITVSLEKKRFGKLMTVIEGLQKSNLDIEKVASDLKKKLACGGTVSEKSEIFLQGDHRRGIKEALVKLGFKAESIAVK